VEATLFVAGTNLSGLLRCTGTGLMIEK
jgi:hypothetical protein